MDHPRLELHIYQLTEDVVMKQNRTDGTGWEWSWADWQREWMDNTPRRHAYRCLPLTIMNQTGWWIKNPVGFTATWRGGSHPGSFDFAFDVSPEVWAHSITNHFGEGIITWTTPFLFRTKPEGSRLLVCGPSNSFKENAHPLMALIESDWISMSFTMNYKVMTPDRPVRFEQGEPLFQAIPLMNNICADLEGALVSYQKLADDPELERAYQEWDRSRKQFHDQKIKGEVKPDEWQRDYFQGHDASGREAMTYHMVKIKPPKVQYPSTNPETSNLNGRNGMDVGSGSPRPSGEGGQPIEPLEPTSSHTNLSRGTPMEPRRPQSTPTMITLEPRQDGSLRPHPEVSRPVVVSDDSPQAAAAKPNPAAGYQVNDEWRRWISENLLIGQPIESMLETMKSIGFAADEAAYEIRLAQQSPYLRGAEILRNRIKKRDWLFTAYRKSNRLHPQSATVERRHRLSRDEFLCEYYSANRPVIITGMMDDWVAIRKWSLDYFSQKFGDRIVEVQMGRNASPNYEVERQKYVSRIKFSEFIEKVRTSADTNDFYLTANNSTSNRSTLSELWDDIVQIPEYLTNNPPGGFFWMGPAGTVTPFHHDLTNNFMAQVIGRKLLRIVPSWDMPLMRNYLHCFSQIDGRVATPTARPTLEQPQILEFILNPGEILFLPIGCMHYVQGLDITVTISFTNFVFDNDYSSFYTTYCPL